MSDIPLAGFFITLIWLPYTAMACRECDSALSDQGRIKKVTASVRARLAVTLVPKWSVASV